MKFAHFFTVSGALGASIVTALASSVTYAAISPSVGLAPYYVAYDPDYGDGTSPPLPLYFPPEVRVIGGGIDPPAIVTKVGRYLSVQRMVQVSGLATIGSLTSSGMSFFGPPNPLCRYGSLYISNALVAGAQALSSLGYYRGVLAGSEGCAAIFSFPPPPPELAFTDRFTFLAPVRRKAIDGSTYDASPMVMTRNGVPWMTYYFGYRLGLVAGESNWDAANLPKVPTYDGWTQFPNPQNNFELVALPPPFIEGEVVEYYNSKVDPADGTIRQFFYAATREDQLLLDRVEGWARSGKTFKSGGYVPVCRYFGGATPDVISHVYSADAKECNETLRANPALKYEGQPFMASLPIPPAAAGLAVTCPNNAIPLYRSYISPSKNGYASSHRYYTDAAMLPNLVRSGWTNEGVVMCVPR